MNVICCLSFCLYVRCVGCVESGGCRVGLADRKECRMLDAGGQRMKCWSLGHSEMKVASNDCGLRSLIKAVVGMSE